MAAPSRGFTALLVVTLTLPSCGGERARSGSTTTAALTTTGSGGGGGAGGAAAGGSGGGSATTTTTGAGGHGGSGGLGGSGGSAGAGGSGPCAGHGGCAEHAACAEVDGGRTCTCDDGWLGDGLECTPKGLHTQLGTWNPKTGAFRVRDSNAPAAWDVTFKLGGPNAGTSWIPLLGDWDGDGAATGALFEANSTAWNLADVLADDPPASTFTWGGNGIPALPVVGNWLGAGPSGIGVYRPSSGIFILRNQPTAGDIDVEIDTDWLGMYPVAGDWDGNGTVTIGAFNQAIGVFRLRNSLDAGPPDATFKFGSPLAIPLAGDWDGDGTTTVGVFDPATREWQLRNDNSAGPADYRFVFGDPGALPVVGVWKKP